MFWVSWCKMLLGNRCCRCCIYSVITLHFDIYRMFLFKAANNSSVVALEPQAFNNALSRPSHLLGPCPGRRLLIGLEKTSDLLHCILSPLFFSRK